MKRRGMTRVSAEIMEKYLLDGCKITSVVYDNNRNMIEFYMEDERFEPVPEGTEPHAYSLIRHDDGRLELEP